MHDNDRENKDVRSTLYSLSLFTSRRDPVAWRQIWNEWSYSEMAEFAMIMADARLIEIEEIGRLDFEHAEQYTAELLSRILGKL